jgi:acyl-CoA synthetase (AMP-forming)/AMP-acid ligase II
VARPDTTIDTGALLRFCSDGLPAFKAPKQIVVSAALPKTERGKLDRKVLVEWWSQKQSQNLKGPATVR